VEEQREQDEDRMEKRGRKGKDIASKLEDTDE
jgi:hypothetical protein